MWRLDCGYTVYWSVGMAFESFADGESESVADGESVRYEESASRSTTCPQGHFSLMRRWWWLLHGIWYEYHIDLTNKFQRSANLLPWMWYIFRREQWINSSTLNVSFQKCMHQNSLWLFFAIFLQKYTLLWYWWFWKAQLGIKKLHAVYPIIINELKHPLYSKWLYFSLKRLLFRPGSWRCVVTMSGGFDSSDHLHPHHHYFLYNNHHRHHDFNNMITGSPHQLWCSVLVRPCFWFRQTRQLRDLSFWRITASHR